MENNILCVDFDFSDPYMNLAYEECLLDYVKNTAGNTKIKMVVATWQNENSVIIGRNQSASEECNLTETGRDNVKIARRITGGGAVYHDMGNLNFTFILPRRYHNIENTTGVIVEALKGLDVNAFQSGRNDILIDGYKFSGNAYYSNDFVGLHHGTVLINSNLDKINRYLTPNKIKHMNRTTNSVAARVANISALYRDITVEEVRKSIRNAFIGYAASLDFAATEIINRFIPDNADFEEKYNKHKSTEWIWKTPLDPPFCEGSFEWGRVVMFFHAGDGAIKFCDIITDSMHLDIWNMIKDTLPGTRLDKDSLLEKFMILERSNTDKEYIRILHDIRVMIEGYSKWKIV